MRIDQLMRKPAITVCDNDTLNLAAQQMWEQDCGVLPVTDLAGKLVGVITDRDVCMAAFTQGLPLTAIPVSSAMARTVYSCRPADSVEVAERSMAEHQLRRLPVVDDAQRPVGVLSLNDIVRHVGGSKNGSKDLAFQTLAAICKPREQRPH